MSEKEPRLEGSKSGDSSTREKVVGLLSYLHENEVGSDREGFLHQMSGLAVGVKPAVTFEKKIESQDQAKIISNLSELGVEAEVFGKLFFNREMLVERLEKDREFALEIGWNYQDGIDGNLDDTVQNLQVLDHARLGFVLGYPVSAIRTYMQRIELGERGIKTPFSLELGEGWDKQDIASFKKMKEEELAIYERDEKARNSGEVDSRVLRMRQMADLDDIKARYEPTLRNIYEKYLGADSEEVDFILSIRGRQIKNPAGGSVYAFAVAGEEGANAPDVLELERKVQAVFENVSRN